MSMSVADRLLAGVWNRLTVDWTRITVFRQMGILGEDAARDAVHKSHQYFVQNQLLHGEYQKLLKDPKAFAQAGLLKQLPMDMTASAVQTFRHTLDASALIFAHSVLDAVAIDCVQICAISAPKQWVNILGGRKVSLEEATTKTGDQLLSDAIKAEVSKLERESLLSKMDRIFQICQPTKSVYLTNGFQYDRERLKQLDDTRHELVHSTDEVIQLANIADNLEFMQKCGLHVFCILAECYDLCFSGTEVFNLMKERHKKE